MTITVVWNGQEIQCGSAEDAVGLAQLIAKDTTKTRRARRRTKAENQAQEKREPEKHS